MEKGLKVKKEEREIYFNLNDLICVLLDYVAGFDLITDIMVTYQLLMSKNIMWAAVLVNSIVSPHLASSI